MAIYWDVKKGVWYVRAFCIDHRGARQHNNKHSFPVKRRAYAWQSECIALNADVPRQFLLQGG